MKVSGRKKRLLQLMKRPVDLKADIGKQRQHAYTQAYRKKSKVHDAQWLGRFTRGNNYLPDQAALMPFRSKLIEEMERTWELNRPRMPAVTHDSFIIETPDFTSKSTPESLVELAAYCVKDAELTAQLRQSDLSELRRSDLAWLLRTLNRRVGQARKGEAYHRALMELYDQPTEKCL